MKRYHMIGQGDCEMYSFEHQTAWDKRCEDTSWYEASEVDAIMASMGVTASLGSIGLLAVVWRDTLVVLRDEREPVARAALIEAIDDWISEELLRTKSSTRRD